MPLTDADYVRAALAKFREITNVSDGNRALAFANIRKAAEHYEVDLDTDEWREYIDFGE